MRFRFTPDEVRDLIDNPGPESGKYELMGHRSDLLKATQAILDKSSGRERLASEQRELDRLYEQVDVTTEALASVTRRGEQALEARNRAGIFGADTRGQSTADSFGAQIAAAIAEVRDGRAQAFVNYPDEVRAISEAGSGGYGVNTLMGAPVDALAARSVVMQLPGLIKVNASTGDRMRFPRFNAVTVGGVAENTALTAAATDIDAVDVIYQKFSTYETASSEWVEDASFDALSVLGNRMLKDLAAKVDIGLLQGTGALDVVGIFAQSGVSTTSVAALPTDFDKVDEAIYQLELNDGNPTAWVMHPRSWRILKQIKTGISSDKTTLLADPANEPRQLRGLPVFTTSAISITSGAGAGSTAAVLDPSQIVVVTRRAPRLEVSRDVNFGTDGVAIRATTRIGLGVLDAAGAVSLLTDIRAS